MSQPPAISKIKKEKPAARQVPADRYTLMLLISLLALITGCVLLYLEISSHGADPVKSFPSAMLQNAVESIKPVFAVCGSGWFR